MSKKEEQSEAYIKPIILDRNKNLNDNNWKRGLDYLDFTGDEFQCAFEAGWDACEAELDSLFQLLPEKIVDEKSHQVYEMSIYHYDSQCIVDYVGEIEQDSLCSFSGNTLHEAIERACNWLKYFKREVNYG